MASGKGVVNRLLGDLAARLLAAASRLLPDRLSPWGKAMERELTEIPDGGSALAFAAGCLRAVLGMVVAAQFASLFAATHRLLSATTPSTWSLKTMNRILARPRLLGLLCAVGAVTAGLAYMQMAGAPPRYLLVNLSALVLGATVWVGLGRASSMPIPGTGPVILALAVTLLLTAQLGIPADGATRWVSVGPLSLQVSLIAVPVMLVLYARHADPVGTFGVIAAALALALQPDRAMAGVMLAGLVALVATKPSLLSVIATGAALLAAAFTLLLPDTLPAVPYVDRILYSAFDVHPVAGSFVVIGAAALIAPAIIVLTGAPSDRPALLVFGASWAGVVIAAALGNSPTPLVGYGGSAILGYLLSVALLPNGAREASRGEPRGAEAGTEGSPDPSISERPVPRLA
jgi:cell division protein FtsW (lipid II flippase)